MLQDPPIDPPRPGNNREYTAPSGRSATSSQPGSVASAASSPAATLLREICCEAAIARPDTPSARSCKTSLALIFLTIGNCSFR